LIPNFDRRSDQPLSKETKTILCTPMLDASSAKVGCVLAINKKKGVFSRHDEAWLKIMSAQYAQLLANHAKHQNVLRLRDYYASFLRSARALGGITSIQGLISGASFESVCLLLHGADSLACDCAQVWQRQSRNCCPLVHSAQFTPTTARITCSSHWMQRELNTEFQSHSRR
jgi:hypothetical protein